MTRCERLFISTVLVFTLVQLSSARGSRLFPWAYTRIGMQAWASGGVGVAMEGIPASALSNPAALHAHSLSVSVEAGKRLPVDWQYSSKTDGQWIVPALVSVDIPGTEWNASAGYANFYNFHLLLSTPETTPANPEGTGRTLDSESSTQVHTAFGAVRYLISPALSIGLTAGVNMARFSEDILGLSASGTGFGVLIIPGILFKPSPSVSLGLAGTLATTVNTDIRFTSEDYTYSLPFPWMLDGGVSWQVSPVVDLLAGLTFQHWSSVSPGYEARNEDRVQVHFGTAVALSSDFTGRLGFFTQSEPATSSQYLHENFLTGGIEYRADPHWTVTGSVLDSHLFSSGDGRQIFGERGKFRQTYIALGVRFSAE